jgi:hypothetical protein
MDEALTVSVSELADLRQRFSGWERCDGVSSEYFCTLTEPSDAVARAAFSPPQVPPPGNREGLALFLSVSGQGTVSVSGPEGAVCTDVDTFCVLDEVTVGDVYTLTATPADGQEFFRWDDLACEQFQPRQREVALTIDATLANSQGVLPCLALFSTYDGEDG